MNKVLFFGNNKFVSLKALEFLIANFKVIACVCDDENENSKMLQCCLKNNINLYSYKTIEDAIKNKSFEKADVGLCCLYRKRISKATIEFPQYGIINFHPSPLPEHRGVAGCCYAILHSCKEWGVSAHYVDEDFDTGHIIKVDKFDISKLNMSGIALNHYIHSRLYDLFVEIASLLSENIDISFLPNEKQCLSEGHYYSKKDLEKDKHIPVEPNVDLDTINRKVKAMWFPPYHGAYVMIGGQKFTLINQEIMQEVSSIYEMYFNNEENVKQIRHS